MQRHVLAAGYVKPALKGQHRLLVTRVQLYGFFFHSRTVHLDTIKVLIPTDAQNNCFNP